MALNFLESKKIPITEYLARLGFEPAKIRGNDFWYRSPFRAEHDPSFKVNTRLNLWYDHGLGEGGTILDLGAKINGCSVVEFLRILDGEKLDYKAFPFHRQPKTQDENKLIVTAVAHLNDATLIDYLSNRAISKEIASQHCLEAEFKIGKREYKAVAFQNQSGGFELRNSWFKGSSSPKDVSYFNADSAQLAVFEGFIDFLSLKQLEKDGLSPGEQSDYLILNSLSFLSRNLEYMKGRESVSLFLDNDTAGQKAKRQLESAGVRLKDQSDLYRDFKDVNEYLIASQKNLARKRGVKI